MSGISLSDHAPFIWSEGNACISSSGDYILAYGLALPERYSLGEKKYDQLLSHLYKMVKSIPPSVLLKQDVFLGTPIDLKRSFDDFLSLSFYDHFNGRTQRQHSCYLFFVLPKQSKILNADFIKSPFRKLNHNSDVVAPTQQMLSFKKDVHQAVSFLNTNPLFSVNTFTEKAMLAYARCYFNAFIPHGFTDSDLEGGELRIGNRHVGVQSIHSVNQLPEAINDLVPEESLSSNDYNFVRLYLESTGLDLPFDHVVNQVFVLENQEKHLVQLKSKQGALFGARGFSPGNKIHAQKLKDYIEGLHTKSDSKLVRFHYNVIHFAASQAQLRTDGRQLTNKFKAADITPYLPTGKPLHNLFFNSFFGYISNLNQQATFMVELDTALSFILPTSTYKNDREGVWFNNRVDNAPLKRDLWDEKKKRIKARNFIINAPTGEGKTVASLDILYQLLQQDYHIVINDLGDSYQKLCLLFPEVSRYIKFEKGKPLGINPFYLNEQPLEGNKLDQLVQFIKTLWKRDNELNTSENTSLRKLIQFYYKEVRANHSFFTFYKFLEFIGSEDLLEKGADIKRQYFDVQQFLHVCSEFVGKGSYAYLFEDTEEFNLDYDKLRLVVFEFGEAKDDPLLVSILLNLSNEIDYKLVWSDRSTRGYIFYDEFAKQLQFPNVLSSVEYKFQAIRKQTAGIGIVLQSPNQLPQNSTASSIIDNTAIFLMLTNTKGYDDVVDRYKLDSHDHNQLMSLNNNYSGEIKYSELFLKIGGYSNVVRLELSKEMLAAFLTEGPEHEKIMALYRQSLDMPQAIQEYLNA